jgi:hypothetical protein
LLNDKILINYPFIKYFDACCNKNITDLNHMGDKLIELHAFYSSGIGDFGIKKLNPQKLYATNYPKIMNII